MADKRSKYGASARDRGSTIIADSAKTSRESFASEFVKRSKDYKIEELPKFIVKSNVDSSTSSRLSRATSKESEDAIPLVIYLTYENGKRQDNLKKVESKDEKISICILDALHGVMQRYKTITVLRLRNCGIDEFGVMLISQMLRDLNCLKDLNLDMNPNPKENFYLLCAPSNSLLYLSLKLCEISDGGVGKIADELGYRDPPNNPKLIGLNLANNRITNLGAERIALTLRTNRSLQSLTLSGNQICDSGALMIIEQLSKTTLMHNEVVELRRRRYTELLLETETKEESKSKLLTEEEPKRSDKSWGQESLTRRSKRSWLQDSLTRPRERESSFRGAEHALRRREVSAEDEKLHPFRTECVPIRGKIVAAGNFQLQHLNLSFNRLTDRTLKALVSCLHYQSYLMLNETRKGLLHVSLQGNEIEMENNEDWRTFAELLHARRTGRSIRSDDESTLKDTGRSQRNVKASRGTLNEGIRKEADVD